MSGSSPEIFVHATALLEEGAQIGAGTKLWHQSQVRTGAKIGERCIVGKGVFVDFDVVIGDDCKVQNYACLYHGVSLGRGVFVGPHVVFTNDVRPRATDAKFFGLRDGDWEVGRTEVGDGAAIGANATILPNVLIGKWAIIAAGAVVTREVAAYALVIGAPARFAGWLCTCGARVEAALCEKCGVLPTDHPLYDAKARD